VRHYAGFPGIELRHGPIAAIATPDLPAVVVKSNGPDLRTGGKYPLHTHLAPHRKRRRIDFIRNQFGSITV